METRRTTRQPKKWTGQRTATPQKRGKAKRDREGAGDGQMKRWRKETVKEMSHGGRPAAN